MERIEQIARDGYWLYLGDLSSDNVLFRKRIMRAPSTSAWAECTTEEKEKWEAEHPQPEE